MLEAVDFTREPLQKNEYKRRRDALMEQLVVLQQEAVKQGVGLVVLFEGWNGAGKGSRISDLMYNLDARATSVYVTEDLDVEAARSFAGAAHDVTGFYPVMQEFWRALGPRGAITFYDRGWYTAATQHMLYSEFGDLSLAGVRNAEDGASGTGKNKAHHKTAVAAVEQARDERHIDVLHRYLTSAADFEQQLVDDGYVVVKFFVHVGQEAQKKRLERLHNDPATRWRVSKEKLASVNNYTQAYRLYDHLLEGSNFSYAPWRLINGEDKRAANLAIAETLVEAIKGALSAQPDPDAAAAAAKAQANSAGLLVDTPAAERTPEQEAAIHAAAEREAAEAHAHAPRASRFVVQAERPVLDEVDHTLALDPETYKSQLKAEQARLNKLEMEMYQKRIPLMIMYEGWDAAGKGGNIKRVAQALDARAYTVFPSPAPTKPELLHPHLWRYWTRLPKAGHVGIYDRSWYGRVLVERVEGFATPAEWGRAYDEINEFERELVRWGAILLKFWVDVSPEEQLRRFHDREQDPAKQWKITDEDWRNRDKYPQYKSAIEDMFRLTSTPFAPWIILESDDKRFARVKALKIINEALEARLREK
ncbi:MULTISPECIES: polyphosphate--AMP phosphotransferase [Gordonibacter]|uniref:Polyphosphate--AMP phosphotransferase n=1 Tax=Gordonibacter faecis TaxID=3047475 RepID=A0ABT7DMM3_9ACTN|nr:MULTISPECIES: polyphosphate--AMP phosphotransferase [unclassified Gordonibacter]MDJ1650771.1 polyphosphate--AMP phosphotransferase [Gordonibacter sp. KGMB12511]HIW77199.1 polyphosphate--AMP phosphotransferase [Candidatus Gordonibacter avicola]